MKSTDIAIRHLACCLMFTVSPNFSVDLETSFGSGADTAL
jgi:hypothetical protein